MNVIQFSGCLDLNEWGDFVAGIFAPIAFIWLVVAVLLQSSELGLQRKELTLTRQEMKLAREVSSSQVDEARRQAEYLKTQTDILKDQALTQAQAQAERVFDARRDSLLAYLRRNPAILKNGSVVRVLETPSILSPDEAVAHLSKTVRDAHAALPVGAEVTSDDPDAIIGAFERLGWLYRS